MRRVRGIVIFFRASLSTTRSDGGTTSTPNVPRRSTTARRAAAGRGHHGDPMALGRFLSCDQRRQLEQTFRAFRRAACRARGSNASATSSAPAIAPVCDAARSWPTIGAPELVDDDRFVGRVRAPRCVREAVGVAQRFEKQQDRAAYADRRPACRSIRRRRCPASLPTEISLENPAPRPSPRDRSPPVMLPDCETIASGPGLMCVHFEHCVHRQRERRPDAEDADAIRPEHAHAARARDLHHCVLHAAAFFAGFGEAVAVDRRDRAPSSRRIARSPRRPHLSAP